MKHGTRSMYCAGKCRCRECSTANSRYRVQYYQKKGAKRPRYIEPDVYFEPAPL